MLTQDRLKELLHYNPETGLFIRKSLKIGNISGYINRDGYRRIRVDYKAYSAHRLVWLYVYGLFPKDQIDHINGIKDDNRLINLRECNRSENNQNVVSSRSSTSKYLGVSWSKQNNKWRADIKINNKNKYLGYFDIEEDAFAAYCKAKAELHKFNPQVRLSMALKDD